MFVDFKIFTVMLDNSKFKIFVMIDNSKFKIFTVMLDNSKFKIFTVMLEILYNISIYN